MQKILAMTTLLSIYTTIALPSELIIFEQWHLSPKVDTTKTDSTKLPQLENQLDIYQQLVSLIKSKKVLTIISEGCQGEIDKNFQKKFNGHSYKSLSKMKDDKLKNVISLIPLKLEVKFKHKVKTLCGDDLDLLNKHSLAYSELRGHFGFYTRLVENKNKNPKKYQTYKNALLKEVENRSIMDPEKYAKETAIEAIDNIKKFLILRNEKFVKIIQQNLDKRPAIIIGKLHVLNLKKQLKKLKIPFTLASVKGIPSETGKELDQIREILSK